MMAIQRSRRPAVPAVHIENHHRVVMIQCGLYPLPVVDLTTMDFYERAIADIPLDALVDALDTWVRTRNRRAAPSDLRLLVAAKVLALPRADEAWEQVRRAILRGGKAMAERPKGMHALTWDVAQRLGWTALCESANIIADRAHFLAAFKEAAHELLDETAVHDGAGTLPRLPRTVDVADA